MYEGQVAVTCPRVWLLGVKGMEPCLAPNFGRLGDFVTGKVEVYRSNDVLYPNSDNDSLDMFSYGVRERFDT